MIRATLILMLIAGLITTNMFSDLPNGTSFDDALKHRSNGTLDGIVDTVAEQIYLQGADECFIVTSKWKANSIKSMESLVPGHLKYRLSNIDFARWDIQCVAECSYEYFGLCQFFVLFRRTCQSKQKFRSTWALKSACALWNK